MKLWMALPLAAYLCGNVVFAERLGNILWPLCEEYLANYDYESLCS